MALGIVRLGTPRQPGEGLRIGTVRRPPRGVRKERFAADDWFDVWLPELAPSAELVKLALAASSDSDWDDFVHRYRKEMAAPSPARLLGLITALSHQTDLSVGCYCEVESRCHRSILGALLREEGADMR